MDWIKVLNRHTIFEYTDLSDSEFVAWIKIMSLTSLMETMPTREQMLRHVHHKTLISLQEKLKTHSTTLQDVLNKVLNDAQGVVERRNAWKEKKKKKREDMKNVPGDVPGDVSYTMFGEVSEQRKEEREEKKVTQRKEEKEEKKQQKPPEKIVFVLPEWINPETWSAYKEMRRRKRAPLTDRAGALIIHELDKLRKSGNDPETVLNQSIMKSWTGVFPISDGGGNGRGSGAYGSTGAASQATRRGTGNSQGGLGLPKVYNPEPLPVISEEERTRNLEKLRQITRG